LVDCPHSNASVNYIIHLRPMSDAAALPPPPRKRCIVYVDAFNWYYGVFIHRPAWKWLNLQSFFETLRLDDDVVAVKLFTALVEPKRHVSPRRDRQQRYLKALTSLPKVQIIHGKYQERTVTCQARDCIRHLEYQVAEEKKTDVNIAVHLMDDAIKATLQVMETTKENIKTRTSYNLAGLSYTP
jgi:hypothetical protein